MDTEINSLKDEIAQIDEQIKILTKKQQQLQAEVSLRSQICIKRAEESKLVQQLEVITRTRLNEAEDLRIKEEARLKEAVRRVRRNRAFENELSDSDHPKLLVKKLQYRYEHNKDDIEVQIKRAREIFMKRQHGFVPVCNYACMKNCKGWNGFDQRCSCGNRRVDWKPEGKKYSETYFETIFDYEPY